jgi:hypothetical protein
MITELKQNISLLFVAEAAGVELKRSGPRHVGLCPFHTEKTPSFYVFPDNKFKCFGCQESGDAIDFVQKMYGLSFKDALKYLGIQEGKITPKVKQEIQRRKREKQKAKAAKKFEADLCYTLSMLVDATHKAMKAIKTTDDFENYFDILQPLPFWEYSLELLYFGSCQDRQEVCQEFKDFEVLQAKRIWSDDFNYRKWLSEFQKNGEPKNVKCQRIEISFN